MKKNNSPHKNPASAPKPPAKPREPFTKQPKSAPQKSDPLKQEPPIQAPKDPEGPAPGV